MARAASSDVPKAEARLVEPHRELADPGQRGAGGQPRDRLKLAAHLAQAGAIALDRLDALRGVDGGGGRGTMLDAPYPHDPRALLDEGAHDAIIPVRSATESATFARSSGACLRNSRISGRRTIAASISGSVPGE